MFFAGKDNVRFRYKDLIDGNINTKEPKAADVVDHIRGKFR